MRCDQCGQTDEKVVRLSTGLQVHPGCFQTLTEDTVNIVFAPGGYRQDAPAA
jgi:hypothetical protein